MINRRKFLEAGAAAGVGAMLPVKIAQAAEKASRMGPAGAAAAPGTPGVSPPLAKYVEQIFPPLSRFDAPQFFTSNGTNPENGALHYDIAACAFTHRFHQSLNPTPVWGYQPADVNGVPQIPSDDHPLYRYHLLANVNAPIEVRYINALKYTDVHPAASGIDRANIDGMIDPATGAFWPDQRIAVHLHGAHVPWTSDGGPKTWNTGPYFDPNNFVTTPQGKFFAAGNQVIHDGAAFNNGNLYYYPNNQASTLLWFHDHAMGITRLNVYAGLAAFYFLENQAAQATFRGSQYEIGIPLVIQDRIFNADGTLYYPPPPEVPEFFGDTIIVNGKVWPRLELAPGQYRLRLLNGCNARFLRMQFVISPKGTLPDARAWKNLPFTQIGAEGGLFTSPALSTPNNVLVLAPAERADLVVDFSTVPVGSSVILFNDASTPFHGSPDTRGAIFELMRFDMVQGTTPTAITFNSAAFNNYGGFRDQNGATLLSNADVAAAIPAVKVLTEITLPNGMLEQLITSKFGTGYSIVPDTSSDQGDQATRGTTELWEIVNTTVDTHPIHMHQSMFRVVDRYDLYMSKYMKAATTAAGGLNANVDPMLYVKDGGIPPEFNEGTGWKDTIRANPGQVTRIAVKWLDYAGEYVYHCHILEHEEHDMMRRLVIG